MLLIIFSIFVQFFLKKPEIWLNNEQIIELIPSVRFNSVSNSQLFQTIDSFYIIFRELWKIYCLSISRFSVTCNCECQTGRRCKNDSFLTFCIQAFSLCFLISFFFIFSSVLLSLFPLLTFWLLIFTAVTIVFHLVRWKFQLMKQFQDGWTSSSLFSETFIFWKEFLFNQGISKVIWKKHLISINFLTIQLNWNKLKVFS